MSYKATVTRLIDLRSHPNANQVQLATCQGNQVVISLRHHENDLGVYFSSDGQLSSDFCKKNNLFRDVSRNADPNQKPGFFDLNGRVRAQKFRGEISDGFWMPIEVFDSFKDRDLLVDGFEFDTLDNIKICNKYVNKETIEFASKIKQTRTAKKSIMFKEHFDTEHFGKNVDKLNLDDYVIITEKLHGTSGRVGNVLVEKKLNWFQKLISKLGINVVKHNWEYLNGTRRVVLEESNTNQFHDTSIREFSFNLFKDKLHRGETVFFEIVGFEPSGSPIMPKVNTKLLNDKNFSNQYGDTMYYSYNCDGKKCDVYVYRITTTNVDGETIDYSWSDVVKRCKELEVKHVPELEKFVVREIVNDGRIDFHLMNRVTYLSNGPSEIDPSHIREGVCVRVEGGLKNQTYKFKSFEFKVLEGIIKDSGLIDQEEVQSL